MLAEPLREPDRAADVLSMLSADDGVGVQRVAVAVEPGDGDAGALKNSKVVVASGVAHQGCSGGPSDEGLAQTATGSAHSDDRGLLAGTPGRLVEFASPS